MKESDRYLKIVEWSDEDQCYIGQCPGLFGGGVHGDDEAAVYRELCEVVDEWVAIHHEDGRPLPPATAQRDYSGKFLLRCGEALHKELAIHSSMANESLNAYCIELLEQGLHAPSIVA